jgi:peptidoglycan/xylan/chitin deacetylase (PgdA/CDA1 family)
MSAVALYSTLKNPFAKYGLKHFITKYRFTLTDNLQNMDIYIGYQEIEGLDKGIQIILHPVEDEKICSLEINGDTIPIFKKPIELNSSEILGKAIDENVEYPCLVRSDRKIQVGFDVFKEIGLILSGHYDEHFMREDEIGAKLSSIPVVDVLEEYLYSAINRVIPDKRSKYNFWPENHRFAVVLTHDVDRVYKTYQFVPSILNSIRNAKVSDLRYHISNMLLNRGENNPYWNFKEVCELENSLGVKSTFYFLNETGKHNTFSLQSWILYKGLYDIESLPVKEVIRNLVKEGFEVGVHGSYNSYNNMKLLQSEKRTLESITGLKIKGVRQHYLNYDESTAYIHHDIGFVYDTSVGYKPIKGAKGFRRGTSFPFQLMLPDSRISSVIEIPLIIMDSVTSSKQKIEESLKLINQVERYNGVLTILWHTNRFNNREYPGIVDVYKEIVNISKSKNAWITTADKVCEWMMR